MTLQFMEKGACGVVSVASHLVGKELASMIRAFEAGDKEAARAIEQKLNPLFKVLFITSNPVPVKAAMGMLGFSVGNPRLPLVEATDFEKDEIRKVLMGLGLIPTPSSF